MTNKELWQTILGELELLVSSANFITWFKDTNIEERVKKEILISVPNGFTKEWLSNKYHKLILNVIQKFCPEIQEIKYVIGRSKNIPSIEQLTPIKDYPALDIALNQTLNNRYNFNNFIVGPFNELAHAASLAVTQKPGKAYNPLFIYGGVGLGKTHLLQAIGNELNKHGQNKKIYYVPAEKFTNELVEAIQHKQTRDFKRRYRQADALLVDDVQFIAGKETTQEEFFHTFNDLYAGNKQIVISSDRPPKTIQTLEERLRSRFEGGMIADISMPDFESRLAILQNKLEQNKLSFNNQILDYIAQNIKDNIRELEGALNRVVAFAQLHNAIPSFNEVVKILKPSLSKSKSRIINNKDIIKQIANFYNINIKDLLQRGRQREIVKPRQIAMYLMRTELNASYPNIGQEVGRRDHTTAIHAYEKIKREVLKNELLEQEINLIKEKLYTN